VKSKFALPVTLAYQQSMDYRIGITTVAISSGSYLRTLTRRICYMPNVLNFNSDVGNNYVLSS